jgi:EAL domain-containing protein (putative c-di-GMP-specific phosphodiesterase class I)
VAYVSASIGITLYPDDATRIEDLFKNADQAMYAAKNQGRNRYSYFTPHMQHAAQLRMQIATDLRGALANEEFTLYYQPIVDLTSGEVRKAEALIRWQHPKHGIISPAAFIPIAEETRAIVEIGNWVLRMATHQVARWRKLFHPDFQVSVNKSPVQFLNDTNPGWLDQLKELDLPQHSIVMEITEGLLLKVDPIVAEKFDRFRAAGIEVALDDFGTGYSSLSYIKKFDIDFLKIDQSFVRNLSPGSSDMALCEAIIVMAHKLGIRVIAEGIETEEQRALLAAAGCDFGQGYYFSRPLPAAELEAVLAQSNAPLSATDTQ